MNFIQSLMSIFQAKNPVHRVTSVFHLGFKGESEALKAKREQAIKNMETWGRTPMLKGGSFDRKTFVLKNKLQTE